MSSIHVGKEVPSKSHCLTLELVNIESIDSKRTISSLFLSAS